MQLFLDLFTTDYGLVALAVTIISLGLAIGFHGFIRKKMREAESESICSEASDIVET
jgi:hypothetical protein